MLHCENPLFALSANDPSIGSGYWTIVNGTPSIDDATAYNTTVSDITEGQTAVLRWTISNGVCPSSSDDVFLLNDPAPVLTAINGTAARCIPAANGTATFSVPALAGTNAQYTWTLPSGMTMSSGSGTANVTVSWNTIAASTGINGNICVRATTACGNGTPICMPLSYNSSAPTMTSSISGPSKLCPGATAIFTVAPTARASSYNWNLPTGMNITSGSTTNMINVLVDTAYIGGTMTSSASNTCGTGATRSKALGRNFPWAPGVIGGQLTGLCNANGVTFTTSGATHANSYSWSVPSGASITGPNNGTSITVNFGLTGGPVTVTGVNTCGTGSTRSATTVTAPSRPASISGPVNVCVNATEMYSTPTVTGATSYNWILPVGAQNLTGTDKIIDVKFGAFAATNQLVSVTATNNCGTSPARSLSGISINSCLREVVQAEGFTALVYPNPVNDKAYLQIESDEAIEVTFAIMDMSGRVLLYQNQYVQAGPQILMMDVAMLPAGSYFMRVNKDGVEKIVRFMIAR
jgi:hypothetical protein